jgi:head-tail adaptor
MISSGRLRFPAVVLRSNTIDDVGQLVDTYDDVNDTFPGRAPIWVDLRTDSAAEQAYADGIATVRRVEIRCRWESAVRMSLTERDRIQVRNRVFRINGITNLDEADMVAVIEAEEVVRQ